MLNLCQMPYSYQNCQLNQLWEGLGQVRSKEMCPETTMDKIFEKNSNFLVK